MLKNPTDLLRAIRSLRPSRWIDAVTDRAARLTRGAAWIWSIGLLAAIGLLDWLSGRACSMTGLYILPVCLAAWTLGARRGLFIGFLAAVGAVLFNGFGDGYSIAATQVPAPVAAWNLFMRGFSLSVISMLVGSFRRSYNLQQRRARTDDLTGALNKHAFHDHLGRAIDASARRGLSLVLVYSDLDGFKAVNDRHGHAVGDSVLVAFADAVGRSIRSRDVLGRVGGDEFVMLLTVASGDDGFAAAERLHRDVSAAMAALPVPVTASMGAVIVDKPQQRDRTAFLTMADTLMYEVKRAGRNALRIAYVDRPPECGKGWAKAA